MNKIGEKNPITLEDCDRIEMELSCPNVSAFSNYETLYNAGANYKHAKRLLDAVRFLLKENKKLREVTRR
jgi:hypothetical protein